jgi:hypothetical protein
VADKLPRFQVAATKASLDSLAGLSGQVTEAIARLARIDDAIAAGEAQRSHQRLDYDKLYIDALRAEVQKVHLFGVDIDPDTPTDFSISIAYIPLQLEMGHLGNVPPLRLDYAEILAGLPFVGNRLLIDGVAGSGKTTLLQWTVVNALNAQEGSGQQLPTVEQVQRRISEWVKSLPRTANPPGWLDDIRADQRSAQVLEWWACTPFLIRLRHCTDGRLPPPEELPRFIAQEAGSPDPQWIREKLRDGKALILLDGVDEVPDTRREEIRTSIERYFRLYRNCKFIVTGRPAAVRSGPWARLFEPWCMSIRPLAPIDIENFIMHWHQALAHERSKGILTDVDREAIQEITAQISSSSALAQLAETPLLCSAICYLHKVRRGELPKRLSSLYEKLCELLVHRLDRERLKDDKLSRYSAAFFKLDLEDKLALLGRLAHFMVREEVSSLDFGRGVDQVTVELRRLRKSDDLTPSEVVRALQERSGVLRGSSETEIEFAHNALRSYLAAGVFAAEGATREVIQKGIYTSDPDLVVLAAARGTPVYRGSLIRGLLDFPNRLEKEGRYGDDIGDRRAVTRQLRLAALRAGATGPVPLSLLQELAKLENRILPPQTVEEARQLSELGERVVVALGNKPDLNDAVAAACVRALRLIGGVEAEAQLTTYFARLDSNSRNEGLGHWYQRIDKSLLEELVQAVRPTRLAFVQRLLQDINPGGQVRRAITRHVKDSDLINWEDPESVSQLGLQHTSVNDARSLAPFRNLKKVCLKGPLKNYRSLGTLHKLGTLFLSEAESDDILLPSSLRVLHLYDCIFDSYAFLGELPNIEELVLDGSNIVNLDPLRSAETLTSISLDYSGLTDLSALARLSNLVLLSADSTSVSSVGEIGFKQRLSTINLGNTDFKDLSQLALFPNLRHVYLS